MLEKLWQKGDGKELMELGNVNYSVFGLILSCLLLLGFVYVVVRIAGIAWFKAKRDHIRRTLHIADNYCHDHTEEQ